MTTRIYYSDSRSRAFDAVVDSCVPAGDRFEVRLDRTAFYPTSGGQPFDTGRIDGVPVVDVIDRDDDGIVHVVTQPIVVGAHVQAEIDWERRRDHMEQHTGQHVLSAAFDATCGAATVGFHMGGDVSTIDLAREVSPSEIAAAEAEANRVIREDRPVAVRIVPADEVASLRLRRESTRSGPLRVVEIQDFDQSACGGTHVARTGEIGMVAVLASERVRSGSRLTFVCGARALAALQHLRDTAADVARLLGVAPADIGAHVARVQQAARHAERNAELLRRELATFRAERWRQAAEPVGRHRVVIRTDAGQDAAELKQLAQAVAAEPGLVVVLVAAGAPAPVVVARSADVNFDAGGFMKAATAALGGRGGGRPEQAQGGLAASPEAIEAFVRATLAND